LILRSAEGAE